MTTAAAQLRILGANDRIRVGIISAGGRGRYLIDQFNEVGPEVAAVCDVYEPNLQAGVKEASSAAQNQAVLQSGRDRPGTGTNSGIT
jgi:hypothetical protein